jgi:nuclear transport factor 2 (NTF2) superfamily protein
MKKTYRNLILMLMTALVMASCSNNQQTTQTDSCTALQGAKAPCPPFSTEDAIKKVRGAEDAWNMKNPVKVSKAYSPDSHWRNRVAFIDGRADIQKFLEGKWSKADVGDGSDLTGEEEYRLIKQMWTHDDDKIAVRFVYEFRKRDDKGVYHWYRAYGNEDWSFDEKGLMKVRHASINNEEIAEVDRKFPAPGFVWKSGEKRPPGHPGLEEMGL